MKRSSRRAAEPAAITKPLFEAGMQCSKRLYLEHHESKKKPSLSEYQQELLELGKELVTLSSQAFPKGIELGEAEFDDALRKTEAFLSMGKPGVLFHGAFRSGGVEVRVDILLVQNKGEVDLFEVKAGTSVKPRHVQDVAMQIRAIEAAGYAVKSASILHLDPRYVYTGSGEHPPQKLFRSADVTRRARKILPRVQEQVESFSAVLEDASTLDLPTGTWCKNPLPCPYLSQCVGEGKAHPLVELPQLTPMQERRMHEHAIESIAEIDARQPGLTLLQRRVVRAVQSNGLIAEPFVAEELRDVDWPLSFLHIGWHLDPMPRLANTRPWLKIPFGWAVHRLGATGYVACNSVVSANAEDPRPEILEKLVKELADAGTVIVYGNGHDERLRALLDLDKSAKPGLRQLLQAPLLELGSLIYHGVYHPGFEGRFDLSTVHRVIAQELPLAEPTAIPELEAECEIEDDEAAARAYAKIIAKRTRATTREKLGKDLEAWLRRSSGMLFDLWRRLK
ncbi:MAG: DUF2779 domain-containing protein [Planctomycetota bacterium]